MGTDEFSVKTQRIVNDGNKIQQKIHPSTKKKTHCVYIQLNFHSQLPLRTHRDK